MTHVSSIPWPEVVAGGPTSSGPRTSAIATSSARARRSQICWRQSATASTGGCCD